MSAATEQPTPLYKILSADGRSCHGGTMQWSLPTRNEGGTWAPGEWMEVTGRGKLVLCRRGLHLTSEPINWWMPETTVYVAEYDGEIVDDEGSDKVCVRRARLLSESAWADHQVYDSGEHVVKAGKARAWGNATVRAWDNATVRAWDNATVEAWDNATVEAGGNATVEAWDNATVRAGGNATVRAGGNATVRAWGNATVRAWGNATVRAGGNATVRAWGNATVRAGGNATVEAGGNATVRAWDNATVGAGGNATVEAWGNATVISTTWHSSAAQVALSQMAAHVDRRGGQIVCRVAEPEAAP